MPTTRGVRITPYMEGPTRPGATQNPSRERCQQLYGEACIWGMLFQAGLLLRKWLCTRGQPSSAGHQHS